MAEGHRVPTGRIVAFTLNLVLIACAAWVYFNQTWLVDQTLLFNYQPPAAVAQLARETTMTDLAQRYFYASHPTIDDRFTFSKDCTNNDEKTVVLGCYNGREIHIFDVTDSRLPGVKDVTAAHETLHAAYQRLSSDERKHVNDMVEAQLKVTNDEHIKVLIEAYNRTEPGELDNEMHSILGTEVQNLSPELEAYYGRYFTNRHHIADLAAAYQKVFTDLQAQQDALLSDLNSLAATIDDKTKELNAAVASFNTDVAAFNAKARSGGFATQDEFDAQRAALVQRQTALQGQRQVIVNMIDDYNAKRKKLEDLNLEATSLNQSINSKLPDVPSV